MKIVTLNIRHGGGTRVPVILEYLDSQNGDVIVLTEFRENANATASRSGLLAQGLAHFAAASIPLSIAFIEAILVRTQFFGVFSGTPNIA